MAKAFLALLMLFLCAATPAAAQNQICFGKFALCTTAKCEPTSDGQYSCACNVMTDYSLGGQPCQTQPTWDPNNGQLKIISRYYPMVSYGICPPPQSIQKINWANCVDAPCDVDPNNPGAATCTCPKATQTLPYVVGATKFSTAMCGQAISSATVSDAVAITAYLQTHNPYRLPVPTPTTLNAQ